MFPIDLSKRLSLKESIHSTIANRPLHNDARVLADGSLRYYIDVRPTRQGDCRKVNKATNQRLDARFASVPYSESTRTVLHDRYGAQARPPMALKRLFERIGDEIGSKRARCPPHRRSSGKARQHIGRCSSGSSRRCGRWRRCSSDKGHTNHQPGC
jgi:hypothetical protein